MSLLSSSDSLIVKYKIINIQFWRHDFEGLGAFLL
jgi:hypothetical protein